MDMKCSDCGDDNLTCLVNGRCSMCNAAAQEAWQARIAMRLDASILDTQKLVNLLFCQQWMHECEIIPAYMPPYPSEDTKPRCVVSYTEGGGEARFLRYSCGPLQGYFWDIYGDDMHSPELAVIALSQAPAPFNARMLIPTHGR